MSGHESNGNGNGNSKFSRSEKTAGGIIAAAVIVLGQLHIIPDGAVAELTREVRVLTGKVDTINDTVTVIATKQDAVKSALDDHETRLRELHDASVRELERERK